MKTWFTFHTKFWKKTKKEDRLIHSPISDGKLLLLFHFRRVTVTVRCHKKLAAWSSGWLQPSHRLDTDFFSYQIQDKEYGEILEGKTTRRLHRKTPKSGSVQRTNGHRQGSNLCRQYELCMYMLYSFDDFL
jgi:hypothetical protein